MFPDIPRRFQGPVEPVLRRVRNVLFHSTKEFGPQQVAVESICVSFKTLRLQGAVAHNHNNKNKERFAWKQRALHKNIIEVVVAYEDNVSGWLLVCAPSCRPEYVILFEKR